jgi:3-oxoacyl-[acyl-carrier-protein] synthase-3
MVPATERLMGDLGWDPATVEALVVVTQGPDFALPATACILQERLGLADSVAAFDVNLGCSGYVYGLWIVAGLMGTGLKRALLCVGDMSTRSISPDDRTVWPLFGDAASVTALEADAAAPPMGFTLGTDGTGAPHLILPTGARRPATPASFERTSRPDGNLRSDVDLYMNGLEVVSFTLLRVPAMIRAAREKVGWGPEDVDAYVLHQASSFVLKALGRAAGIPRSRLVVGLEDRGNTSSASIPLAMSDKLREALGGGPRKLLLAGFGVGWSFAAATVEAGPLLMPEVLVVPDRPPDLPPGLLDESASRP